MEYLLYSHNIEHKDDKVDVPSLAELVMTLPPFLLHRILDFATVRIPAKKNSPLLNTSLSVAFHNLA
jgi:hypothetical protein